MNSYENQNRGASVATRLNAVALIVFVAALLLPMLMNDGGPRGYQAAGKATAYILFGAVVFGSIAVLSIRARSAVFKAGAWLVVATLLLGLSALGTFR